MTPAEISALAAEAGFSVNEDGISTPYLEHIPITPVVERFAALVASKSIADARADEREACAALSDAVGNEMLRSGRMQARAISRRVSNAIRARGQS